MCEFLPKTNFKFGRKIKIGTFIKTSDISDAGYFNEVDLSYLYKVREKTETLPFAPDKKIFNLDDFTP